MHQQPAPLQQQQHSQRMLMSRRLCWTCLPMMPMPLSSPHQQLSRWLSHLLGLPRHAEGLSQYSPEFQAAVLKNVLGRLPAQTAAELGVLPPKEQAAVQYLLGKPRRSTASRWQPDGRRTCWLPSRDAGALHTSRLWARDQGASH